MDIYLIMYKYFKHNYARIKSIFLQSLFKNASYLIFGSAISSFVGFVFIYVSTKLYTSESVGLSSAAIAAIGLISLISEFGLGISLIHFLPNQENNGNKLLNFCFTINIMISTTTSLVYLFGLDTWSPALVPIRQNISLTIVFLLFAIGSAMHPLLNNVFLSKRKSHYIVIISTINGFIKILAITLVSFFLNSTFGILLGAGISTIFIIILILCYYLPKVQPRYQFKPTLRYKNTSVLFKYSIGNYVGRFLLQMTPLLLPIIVLNVLGAESNASFYVAWSVYSVLLVIPSATYNSLFAESSSSNYVSYRNVISSTKFMLGLVIPAIMVVIIFADKLLLIFGKSYSVEATSLLRILIVSIIPWGVNYLYVSISRSSGQMKGLLFISGLSAVLSIILCYVLVLNIGLIGVGIGYLSGQSICALIVVFILTKTLKRTNDYHRERVKQ